MMTYEFDAAAGVIHLRASGELVATDPIAYFREIDADPEFLGPAQELIYFTDLEDIKFSYTDVFAIRNAFEKYDHGAKISDGKFLVDSELSYGMARMVMGIFGDVFTGFSIERRG